MFQAAGFSGFLDGTYSDSYADTLYKGQSQKGPKTITPQIRDKISTPIKLDNVKGFFERYIDKTKTERLCDDFSIDRSLERSFDALAASLASMFIEYCIHEEDQITKTINDFYKDYLSNPSSLINQDVDNDYVPFILEMKGACPLCQEHAKLYIEHNGKQKPNYRPIHIFPLSVDSALSAQMHAFKSKPTNLSSQDNIIVLCPSCANLYTLDPNIEDYKTLVQAKETAKQASDLDKLLKDPTLEEQLISVLGFLLNQEIDETDLPELSMDAKVIAQKIPNIKPLTYTLMSSVIAQTFPVIDKYLSNEFGKDKNDSTTLGKQIKRISKKLMSQGKTGQTVVDEMIVILNDSLPETHRNMEIVKVVVYYFLQHCEVLSE